MNNFEFENPTRILFGQGMVDRLSEHEKADPNKRSAF
jgi:alcohol dehydrogenase YqhD (iron-dependent ADH family)